MINELIDLESRTIYEQSQALDNLNNLQNRVNKYNSKWDVIILSLFTSSVICKGVTKEINKVEQSIKEKTPPHFKTPQLFDSPKRNPPSLIDNEKEKPMTKIINLPPVTQIDEEQKKIPIDEEQKKIPIDEEQKKIPIDEEQKKIPIDEEQKKMGNALHLIDFIKLNPEMFKGDPSAGDEEEFKKFKDAMDKDPYFPIDKSINPNYICRLLAERFKEIKDRIRFDYLINKVKELEIYKEISAANALHLIDYINSNAWILNVPNIFLANGDDDEYKKLKKMMDES